MTKVIEDFSFYRLGLLMRSCVVLQRRSIGWVALTLGGVLFLYILFSAIDAAATLAQPHIFLVILFILGLWTSSKAWHVIHVPLRARHYFLIPASLAEKFFSQLLLTSVGMVGVILLAYYLLSLCASAFAWLTTQQVLPIFQLTDISLWRGIGIYLILQAIVLLASAYFRSHCLLKLCLTLGVIKIALFIFLLLLSIILFKSVLAGSEIFSWHLLTNLQKPTFLIWAHWIFLIGLMPFCWVVTYLRLQEQEI